MARGALIQAGVVIAITEAASGINLNYEAGGIAFVPDDDAQLGDLWNGAAFTYFQSPQSITVLQARLALTAAQRTAIETAMAASDQATKDFWQFAITVNRNGPVVTAIKTRVGWTDAQVDAFFRAAAKL